MEQTILTALLFVFSFAFFVKMIIFGVLAHEMRPRNVESPLGRALFRHYLSLSVQSFFLTTLYFYYGRGAPWGESWPYKLRITLYLLSIVNVGWVVISGIQLLRTVFTIRSETTGKIQEVEERDARQDKRGAEQDRESDRQETEGQRQQTEQARQQTEGARQQTEAARKTTEGGNR